MDDVYEWNTKIRPTLPALLYYDRLVVKDVGDKVRNGASASFEDALREVLKDEDLREQKIAAPWDKGVQSGALAVEKRDGAALG